MAVTINQIATLCGVSRGTVDRALHNKSGVRPEVAARIRQVALEQGYVTNRTAPVSPNAPIRIGVILHSASTDFVHEIITRIHKKALELESQSVHIIIRSMNGVDVQQQVALIHELVESEHIHGLTLMPLASDAIKDAINKLSEHYGIPVVTFNTDIPESRRIAYVGPDDLAAGRAASELMRLATKDTGLILPITGRMNGHFAESQRMTGFTTELQKNSENMSLLEPQYCYHDPQMAERIVLRSINAYPDLRGIYISSAGRTGVYQALQKSGQAGKIHLIVHDLIPNNLRMIQEGIVDFAIGQDTKVQSILPTRLLLQYLTRKRAPKHTQYFTDVEIKFRYNISSSYDEIL